MTLNGWSALLCVPVAVLLAGAATGDDSEPNDFDLEKVEVAVKVLKKVGERLPEATRKVDEQRRLDNANGSGDEISPELTQLRAEVARLSELQARAVAGIERSVANVPEPYLQELASETDELVLTTIVPIATKVRARDKVAPAVIAAARRFKTLPPTISDTLGRIGGRDVRAYLIERGKADGDPALLAQAGREGSPDAIDSILKLTRESDANLAALGEKALMALPPPSSENARLTVGGIEERLADATASSLRQAILYYVGSMPSSTQTMRMLERAAGSSQEPDEVRIMACRGLQEAVRREGDFASEAEEKLLDVLSSNFTATGVRRSVIAYLGEVKSRRATAKLIELLGDKDLAATCATSLQRITGLSFGTSQETWERWYANTPEGQKQKGR